MSETDYLVGVEEYELAYVESVLDDDPEDAQTVYKETLEVSERAIASVAALRAIEAEGGSTPTGAAGGVLGGTYPNPSFAADMATQAELDAHVNDSSAAHAASAISIEDSASDFTATDVEGALAELQSDAEAHVAAADPHTGYVLESLYDANTVLKADSDNTPAALTMGASTILARLAAGNIKAASVAEIGDLLGPSLSGYQLAYAERTSNLTVTATSEGASQDVVSSGAVTYDGTAVWIEFFAPRVQTGNAASIVVNLFDDTTPLGALGGIITNGASTSIASPFLCRRKLTPSAGSHTYKITAHRATADGTVNAGSGGTGAFLPAYIRVTKA